MTENRVLVSCLHLQRHIDKYRDLLLQRGIEVETPAVAQQLSEDQLVEIIGRFDGVIAGDDEFTAKVLQKAERLKILIKWGIGVDAIDLDEAARLGIPVKNTPAMFGDEVADVTMGYIIMLARGLHQLDRGVRRGEWPKIQGMSLRGKTLGVIGLGDIGRAACRRAAAFGMRVIGYDPVGVCEDAAAGGVRPVDLNTLLEASDIISLSCALTADNRHLLGRPEFARMQAGVLIVNAARGTLIDEAALAAALASGRVGGAALDVFENEPLPDDSPLRAFDNCIFGTHNGSNTLEAVERVNDKTVEMLVDALGVKVG
jgi:D-3-phosphoglycerate dehydrogenase / 2-oxoglutarate reductase